MGMPMKDNLKLSLKEFVKYDLKEVLIQITVMDGIILTLSLSRASLAV